MSAELDVLKKRLEEVNADIQKLNEQISTKQKELDAYIAEKQQEADVVIKQRRSDIVLLQQNFISALGASGEIQNIIAILEKSDNKK